MRLQLVRREEPCPYRPIADSQIFGDLLQGLALRSHPQNPVRVHGPLWAAQFLAICPCIPNPGTYPLTDQVALKLSNRRHDGKKRLPQRSTRIHILLVTDKLYAQRPKFFQRREKVFGGAGEAIKTPHHNCVELPLPGVVHQFIKFRARVFCARLAHVNVFANQFKSSGRAVGPQITYLQLAALVLRADTRIYSDSHELVLQCGERKRLYFRSPRFSYPRSRERTFKYSSSAKPPVGQCRGERVLNLLGDIFLRSQNVTDKEFIANMERRGIEYTVRRIDTGTYIEVGRFGYETRVTAAKEEGVEAWWSSEFPKSIRT
jgi:hypothetical protein